MSLPLGGGEGKGCCVISELAAALTLSLTRTHTMEQDCLGAAAPELDLLYQTHRGPSLQGSGSCSQVGHCHPLGKLGKAGAEAFELDSSLLLYWGRRERRGTKGRPVPHRDTSCEGGS